MDLFYLSHHIQAQLARVAVRERQGAARKAKALEKRREYYRRWREANPEAHARSLLRRAERRRTGRMGVLPRPWHPAVDPKAAPPVPPPLVAPHFAPNRPSGSGGSMPGSSSDPVVPNLEADQQGGSGGTMPGSSNDPVPPSSPESPTSSMDGAEDMAFDDLVGMLSDDVGGDDDMGGDDEWLSELNELFK